MVDREVVDEIVEKVLKRLEGTLVKKEIEKKPTLLVVNALDHIQIEQLQKHWIVQEVISPSEATLENVNEVLFLNVTQDLLVKGAVGITDTPESELLAKALLQGFRIHLVPSPLLEWILGVDCDKAMNKKYVKHILNYKNELETFNANVTSFTNVTKIYSNIENGTKEESEDSLITFHEKLLTQKDVINSKVDEILVGRSTIITPLAFDVARELDKSINVIDAKKVVL